MTLGQAMRKARKDAGVTLLELGEKSGYNPSYLGEIERGKYAPRVTTVIDLADVLGISLDEYIGRKEHNEGEKVTVLEIPDDMIIFKKDKWLAINLYSEDLGKAIRTLMDYLTHERRGK